MALLVQAFRTPPERISIVARSGGLRYCLLFNTEPDGEAVKQRICPNDVGERKALLDHQRKYRLLPLQDGIIGKVRAAECFGSVAVRQERASRDIREGDHAFAPWCFGRQSEHLVARASQDLGRHLVEQVLLTCHVPVERRRLDAESCRNCADGQAVYSCRIEHIERRPDDLRLRESWSHLDSLTKISDTSHVSFNIVKEAGVKVALGVKAFALTFVSGGGAWS